MKRLSASHHRRMPWKNGGGETVEIAVSPQGATLDDFDWRVSMVRVERDGPFSSFPGIDRTLAILEGEGVVLDVAGQPPLRLTRQVEPISFPADAPTSCRLIAGPILDLNVMSRRGRVDHSVRLVRVDGPADIAIDAPVMLILCLDGVVAIDGVAHGLARHDCVVLETEQGTLRLSAPGRATAAVIEFRHI